MVGVGVAVGVRTEARICVGVREGTGLSAGIGVIDKITLGNDLGIRVGINVGLGSSFTEVVRTIVLWDLA